jgi:hypothetical protein
MDLGRIWDLDGMLWIRKSAWRPTLVGEMPGGRAIYAQSSELYDERFLKEERVNDYDVILYTERRPVNINVACAARVVHKRRYQKYTHGLD